MDPAEKHTRAEMRDVYDEIGSHFAKTRANPWPEVIEFLDGRSGGLGLDLGTGNGRHAKLLWEHTDSVIALDLSRELLRETQARLEADGWQAALVQGDAADLPLHADSVDIAVYVATLHHLPEREMRRESLDELARVLGPDGTALVSVWSTTHDSFDASPDASEGFDTTVDWTLPGGETVPRFYHIYAAAEFGADLTASDLAIEDWYVSSGNCYAEVEGKRP